MSNPADAHSHVRAPATIANLGPGFDCMGLALKGLADEVQARWSGSWETTLESIEGVNPETLPLDVNRNCASVAAIEALRLAGEKRGVALRLHKGLPGGSGLGSSSASSVAGAVAVHRLLGDALSEEDLLKASLCGERAACGSAHPDNVAPALFGGLVLIRSTDPIDWVRVAVPESACFAIILPHREVRTEEARRVLPQDVPLASAVENCRNAASLILAVARGDLQLWGRSTRDCIVEPARAPLLPGLEKARQTAMETGALGFSVSGSGPALFALCDDSAVARRVSESVGEVFRQRGDRFDTHVLRADNQGALGFRQNGESD